MAKTEQDTILDGYKPMVDYLADTLGNNTEVVLHDLRDPAHSIIKIRNNEVTGRDLNSGVTDFALNILVNEEEHRDKTAITNYFSYSDNGKKLIRSSSLLIRDKSEHIIGMLCMNIDITAFMNMRDILDQLIMDNREEFKQFRQQETFTTNIFDLLEMKIQNQLSTFDVDPERLTPGEKKEIVARLNKEGVFLLKGAVTIVSERLVVSEQSIYRYLKEFDKQEVRA